ncbi:adenylate kinase [Ruminococcaceae bacterium OttesenSCG-928-N02]|nr:adenylate kinase [Ruminococcaceae bacterium OttesenSCG-928-N02]
MNLILLGAPGAGKGTQAEILCDKLGIVTISTGNILREAVKNGTDLGKEAKGYMDAGELVPDELIIGILKDRLAQPDCANGFILDGVPRTLAQAQTIEAMGIVIDKALNIAVRDENIITRMSGRRVCEKCGASYHVSNNPPKVDGVCDACAGVVSVRKDDAPETVRARLDVYHAQTAPLIGYYEQKGILVEVDGEAGIEATTAAILEALGV